jgi:hypothetical protein
LKKQKIKFLKIETQPDSSKVEKSLLQNHYFAGFTFFSTRARAREEREREVESGCLREMRVLRMRLWVDKWERGWAREIERARERERKGEGEKKEYSAFKLVLSLSLSLSLSPPLSPSLSLSFLRKLSSQKFRVSEQRTYCTKIKMVGQNSTGWGKINFSKKQI